METLQITPIQRHNGVIFELTITDADDATIILKKHWTVLDAAIRAIKMLYPDVRIEYKEKFTTILFKTEEDKNLGLARVRKIARIAEDISWAYDDLWQMILITVSPRKEEKLAKILGDLETVTFNNALPR